jgi:hypothetical protein
MVLVDYTHRDIDCQFDFVLQVPGFVLQAIRIQRSEHEGVLLAVRYILKWSSSVAWFRDAKLIERNAVPPL